MSEYNTKNYTEQGGEKTVIGGTLEIKEGASVTGLTSTAAPASAVALGGVKAAAISTSTVRWRRKNYSAVRKPRGLRPPPATGSRGAI